MTTRNKNPSANASARLIIPSVHNSSHHKTTIVRRRQQQTARTIAEQRATANSQLGRNIHVSGAYLNGLIVDSLGAQALPAEFAAKTFLGSIAATFSKGRSSEITAISSVRFFGFAVYAQYYWRQGQNYGQIYSPNFFVQKGPRIMPRRSLGALCSYSPTVSHRSKASFEP